MGDLILAGKKNLPWKLLNHKFVFLRVLLLMLLPGCFPFPRLPSLLLCPESTTSLMHAPTKMAVSSSYQTKPQRPSLTVIA